MGYDYSTYYSNYNYNYDMPTTLVTAILGALMVYLFIILVIAVIQLIAMWKLYKKAGEKGWKSIVPIYNLVILFKISGLSPWLIFAYFAIIIPFIGWLVPIALNAVLSYKLAKSYGKDGGWAVGLYFLPTIFYMILAFGKSQYVGPGGETVTCEDNVIVENNNENTEN